LTDITPRQKNLLCWIIKEVNSDRLPEAGIRFKFSQDGSRTIENYEGDQDDIPVMSISAQVIKLFIQKGYLIGQGTHGGSHKLYECTLTKEAYSVAELETEYFFPKGATHDAYVKIKEILRSASISVIIVDPYIDGSIFQILTSNQQPKLSVKLLTSKLPSDFALEARKFTTQHSGISLEVKKTNEFHDRFIILDDSQCYHVGASIKDAGTKVFMISQVEDQQNVDALLQEHERSWKAASFVAF
jgi:hypothetical protein